MKIAHVLAKPSAWKSRTTDASAVMPTITLHRLGAPMLRAYDADTFYKRLLGLHRLPALGLSDAILIRPCWAIQTFKLRKPIDVVFLDRRGLILRVETLVPGKMSCCWGAHAVVEMANGTASRLGLATGQVLHEAGSSTR